MNEENRPGVHFIFIHTVHEQIGEGLALLLSMLMIYLSMLDAALSPRFSVCLSVTLQRRRFRQVLRVSFARPPRQARLVVLVRAPLSSHESVTNAGGVWISFVLRSGGM